MSGPTPVKGPPPASGWGGGLARVPILTEHFFANLERYTAEALRASALEAGYSPEEVEQALGIAAALLRDHETARPVRARARRLVLVSYAIVYGLLAALLIGPANQGGYGTVALVVLTVTLGIALLLSIQWIATKRRSADRLDGALAVLLAVPMVLLVAVAGLCLFSSAPAIFPTGV